MRLSAAQLAAEPGDVARNVRVHVAAVEVAVSQRSDLVLFPELSLTGYEPKLASELATRSDDRRLDVFQALADDFVCAGRSAAWNRSRERVVQMDEKASGLVVFDTSTQTGSTITL